jgi:uncharacterized protein (TIGR01777 family)
VQWDGVHPGEWTRLIEEADVVINLAGRSVNCRYTEANREAIRQSRILSTRAIGQAIASARRAPRLWLQSSTATIYAHTLGPAHGEDGQIGGNEPAIPATWRFSVQVAKDWEAEALKFASPSGSTRLVLIRSAFVMSPDPGGPFDVLMNLARFGLGGSQGSGRQFVSGIHDVDFVRAVDWIVARPELVGPVNLASPFPLPNGEFMNDLRQAAGRKAGLPSAKWMLEIGALAMRTETELLLKSRRVVPTKLLRSGFHFRYPHLPEAVYELTQRWRQGREPLKC